MKIQSVAILGAGAVGCYVLWGLADKAAANSLQLGVVAEGSRAERLRQNGCTINGQVYHPQVWTPQQAHGVDLLIVALKYGALPGALDSIRTIVSEHTVVMSLMNGVDSEDLIAAQVGAAHVLPALIKVASHRTGDGVRFDPETTIGIIYGELTAPFVSDRVQAVRALFADTDIHFRVTEHICEEIWSKFRLNVCNNLPQAILGAGVGCYSDSAHIKAISDGLRRELEAIAAAKGGDTTHATRGFLTVQGKLAGDDITFVVCHWPSRGAEGKFRDWGGKQVRHMTDSIMKADPDMRVVVMGDMNDDPDNTSMAKFLGAKKKMEDVGKHDFFNPWWTILRDKGQGTLSYKGGWNLFDQIVMSRNLLDVKKSKDYKHLTLHSWHIFRRDYLIQQEGKYKGSPLRTTAGGVWLDGYSDHLPTVTYFVKEL